MARTRRQRDEAAYRAAMAKLPPLSDYAATAAEKTEYQAAMRRWLDDDDCATEPPVNPDSDHARSLRRDAAIGITYTSNRPRRCYPGMRMRNPGR
jgi:hypothetical protein